MQRVEAYVVVHSQRAEGEYVPIVRCDAGRRCRRSDERDRYEQGEARQGRNLGGVRRDDRMFVVAVIGFTNDRDRTLIMAIVQIVHYDVHRHRRSEQHEDQPGE